MNPVTQYVTFKQEYTNSYITKVYFLACTNRHVLLQ